jgi:hypothetical protein
MAKMQPSQVKSEILWGCTIDTLSPPPVSPSTLSFVIIGMSFGPIK